jgi:O-antigen biosynthesis protein
MRKVDVIIPSKAKLNIAPLIAGYRFLLDHKIEPIIHLMLEGNSWSEAINAGLAESKNDVLICDDDIVLYPDTFKDLEDNFDKADIFGFKLLFPSRKIQHAGGFITETIGHRGFGEDQDTYNEPEFVDHVTASLMYIKKEVIEKIGGMATDYPGYQFEDVDFNIRAKKAGFKIMYLPGKAIHYESFTKKLDPEFNEKLNLNYAEIKRRYNLV